MVLIAAPILASDGQSPPLMTCTLNLLKERLFGEARNIRIGKTGYLFIASRDRQIVLHPDKSRILAPPSPVGGGGRTSRRTRPARDSRHGGGHDRRRDRGADELQAAADGGLVRCRGHPLEEAYAPLRETRSRVFTLALFSTLAGGICAWLLAGLLVSPVVRLTRHVSALRGQPEAALPRLPSRNDEIGALAGAFSSLFSALRERETGLKKSEEKFAKAFQSNPDFIMINRMSDGLIIEVNRGFEIFDRLPRRRGRGAHALRSWAGANPEGREQMIERLKVEGSVRDLECVSSPGTAASARC